MRERIQTISSIGVKMNSDEIIEKYNKTFQFQEGTVGLHFLNLLVNEVRASERQIILAELKKEKIECQEGCVDHDAYNALVDAMITTVEKMKP